MGWRRKIIIANQEALYIYNFIMWVGSCTKPSDSSKALWQFSLSCGGKTRTRGGVWGTTQSPGALDALPPAACSPSSDLAGTLDSAVAPERSSVLLTLGLRVCWSLGPGERAVLASWGNWQRTNNLVASNDRNVLPHSWEGRLPNRGIGRTRLRLTGSSLAFISFWSLSTILGCPLTCRFLSPVPHHFLPVYSHVMPPRGPVSVSLFVRIPVILDWGYPNDLTSTWLPLWRPYFQIRSSSCITRL